MAKAQTKKRKLDRIGQKPRTQKNPNSLANLSKGPTSPDVGRPKNEASIVYWLKEFAPMTPMQLSKLCGLYAKELRKGGDDLSMAGIVAVRVYMDLINHVDPRLLQEVDNRLDGKVPLPIEDWRSKLVNNGVNPDHILRGLVESVIAARAKRPNVGSLGDGAERVIESATSPSVAVESTISQS